MSVVIYLYKITKYLDVGFVAGVVTGYEEMDPAPLLIPTVTFGPEFIKGRLLIIPTVVVAYQLMLEF